MMRTTWLATGWRNRLLALHAYRRFLPAVKPLYVFRPSRHWLDGKRANTPVYGRGFLCRHLLSQRSPQIFVLLHLQRATSYAAATQLDRAPPPCRCFVTTRLLLITHHPIVLVVQRSWLTDRLNHIPTLSRHLDALRTVYRGTL